jgi:hypothetical protein
MRLRKSSIFFVMLAAIFVIATYCKSMSHNPGFAYLEYEAFTMPSVLPLFTKALNIG